MYVRLCASRHEESMVVDKVLSSVDMSKQSYIPSTAFRAWNMQDISRHKVEGSGIPIRLLIKVLHDNSKMAELVEMLATQW